MTPGSTLCIISFVISLRSILQMAACPSGHCACDSLESWSCTLKIDDDQIDCNQWELDDKLINVQLDLVDLNINRKSIFFTNIHRCRIVRLKIAANIVPLNKWIGNLNRLEHLIIHNKPGTSVNGFNEEIDNLLFGLDSLVRLKIENLQIRNWSSRILETCPMVQEVELKMIKVEDLELGSFGNCKHLKTLIIRFNNIRKLFISSFSGLSELQILILSSNQLEEIITYGNGWWEMRNLTKLDFSYNSLKKLDPKSFIGLSRLKQLNLNMNQLEFIDKTAFEGVTSLNSLNLKNNPKLILFDLMALAPMSNSLTMLHVDIKSIQCIDMKAQLNRFHSQIRAALKYLQDCNRSDKLSSGTTELSLITFRPVYSAPFVNLPLIISLAVLTTILVMGLVFFFLYYSTSKKKIGKYRSEALERVTTISGNSAKGSHSFDIPLSNYTMESQKYTPSLNNSFRTPTKLIPRYTSDPMLPRL